VPVNVFLSRPKREKEKTAGRIEGKRVKVFVKVGNFRPRFDPEEGVESRQITGRLSSTSPRESVLSFGLARSSYLGVVNVFEINLVG